MKSFLLIDDHFVVRSGIKSLLAEIYKPCTVQEAADSGQAVAQLKEQSFDLVVMDVNIPGNDMMGLMEYIHVRHAAQKVMVFSMSPEALHARRFLQAGAKGFLSKDSSAEEMIKAINLVLAGRRYISDALAQILATDSMGDATANPFNRLSPREFEIACLLLKGEALHQIAKLLHVKPSTAGTHKAKLFKKMAVSNLMQLQEIAAVYIPK